MPSLFSPLWEHGYFVNIFSESRSNESSEVVVNCILYFTDVDVETGGYTLLRLNDSDPIYQNGFCVACDNTQGYNTGFQRGSITCPLCSNWTMPWTLTKKDFRGIFKLNPGEPATFLPLETANLKLPEGTSQIYGEQMIWAISQALSKAHLYKL
jgi:hypothetical protein